MDTITLPTFASDQQTAIENAFSAYYGYQTTNPDGSANTQTVDDFVVAQIVAYIDNIVLEQANRDALAGVQTASVQPAATAMTTMMASEIRTAQPSLGAQSVNL